MKFKNTLFLLQILLQLADLKAIKVEIGDTSTPQVSRREEKEEPIAWEVDEVETLHEESSSSDRRLNVNDGETIFSIRNNNNDGKVVGKKKRGQREASNSSTSTSDDSSNVFFGSGKSL